MNEMVDIVFIMDTLLNNIMVEVCFLKALSLSPYLMSLQSLLLLLSMRESLFHDDGLDTLLDRIFLSLVNHFLLFGRQLGQLVAADLVQCDMRLFPERARPRQHGSGLDTCKAEWLAIFFVLHTNVHIDLSATTSVTAVLLLSV